ncbi:MAG: hypothetical protein LC802_06535 [Acidobacteria bacterium]|nr:hypothetical protein [Acidobacteriota bacterium]
MYDTSGTQSICHATFTDYDIRARVSWLKAELACDERGRRRLARRADEESQAMRMREPLSNAEAFAWFGTFLGLFPPAALFSRALHKGVSTESDLGVLLVCIVMNFICCVVGRAMGRCLGGKIGNTRERAWLLTLLSALLLGFFWAVVTGAAGGLLVFGIGAFFGALCAGPVALAGFPAFMLLHRLLSRGGMIEERQLWPLAFGVPCVIAALILSPSVFK